MAGWAGAKARIHWRRVLPAVAAGVILLFVLAEFLAVVTSAAGRGAVGQDHALYLRIADRWLATGELYWPHQLSGPYLNQGDVNVYPPPTVLFFLPFLFLPPPAWWAIPIGILAWHLWDTRPARWTWPLLSAALIPVDFHAGFSNGGTTMWLMAAVAIAVHWPAAAMLLAFKPSAFPFALLFARDRWWWVAGLAMATVATAFAGYWLQWFTVVRNFAVPDVLTYTLNPAGLALLLWPIVAWIGRRQRTASMPTSPRRVPAHVLAGRS